MADVCLKRLQKELISIQKSPVAHISTTPNENNLLEWHYVIEGPPGSVYEGGYYHGVLRFPKEYPYKPPSILMFTRNGRFKQNVRLCLSMSDYHPELWNPMWSVSAILSGLMSFMLDSASTLGSIETTEDLKRQYARESLRENLKNPLFKKLFPKYIKIAEEKSRVLEDQTRERDLSVTAEALEADALSQENDDAPVANANVEHRGQRRTFYQLAIVAGTTLITAAAVGIGLVLNGNISAFRNGDEG